jgi:putative ABC transport system ATP-binding protein
MSAVREETKADAITRSAARARDVVKVYGSGETQVRALDAVTIDLAAERFTAIMGPRGRGSRRSSTVSPGSTRSHQGRSFSATRR